MLLKIMGFPVALDQTKVTKTFWFAISYMVTVEGLNRSSHIAGSSVHNQCVEQIWRDVY